MAFAQYLEACRNQGFYLESGNHRWERRYASLRMTATIREGIPPYCYLGYANLCYSTHKASEEELPLQYQPRSQLLRS